jgi:KaiC/GvpD/RAD55 family RecA-like ATPase/DNA-binding response OmpR family regulator
MEGIPTGVEFLDSGAEGFYRTKPYLVFGASGTGKSIFGLQFVHAGLERGEGALYVCREKAEDLIQQGERLGLGLVAHAENERLVVLEYDADFREIVTRQGPEAVLEELRGQLGDLAVRRVVFDPVDAFFSSLDDEALLRGQLRAVVGHAERLGWTPLLLSDDVSVARQPFVMRVFSEVCWGVFELRRSEGDAAHHELLVYKMRNVSLERSRFEYRIGEGGIRSLSAQPAAAAKRPSFARFRPGARGEGAGPAPDAEPRRRRDDAADLAEPGSEVGAGASASSPAAEPALPPAPSGGVREAPADSLDLLDDADLEALERAAETRVAPVRAPSRAASPAKSAESPRAVALLADASAPLRAEIARVLGRRWQVLEASDGRDALDLAARAHPDLLVAGFSLARLNGIGLCRILREQGVEVPLVIVSARGAPPAEGARALLAGADAALGVPFDATALAGTLRELLRRRAPGSVHWPVFEPAAAAARVGPRRWPGEAFEQELASLARCAREADLPLCLLGYEFRFVGQKERAFVDLFVERLTHAVRGEDHVSRLGEDRVVLVLVDCDEGGARAVVSRVHEFMSGEAAAFLGEKSVKPKALYRMLTLQPDPLEDDAAESPCLERLFKLRPRLIEEDLPDRPGEPVEKYPLLEAVFHALGEDRASFASPLDGSSHAIESEGAVRAVSVGDHRYETQDPGAESQAGFRAARGARIIWVLEVSGRVVARIEDGRVFRGREA